MTFKDKKKKKIKCIEFNILVNSDMLLIISEFSGVLETAQQRDLVAQLGYSLYGQPDWEEWDREKDSSASVNVCFSLVTYVMLLFD